MSTDTANSSANATRAARLRRHGLAWLLFGLICALAALDFILLALCWATPVPDVWGFRGDAAIWGLAFGLVGQLLARRRPRNPIGWLFLLAGLVSAIGRLGIEYSTYVLLTRPGLLPGGSFAAWMASWLWFVMIGVQFYVFQIFPTGQLLSAAWRPVAWFVAGAIALGTVGFMFRPGPLGFAAYLDNPLAGSVRVIDLLNRATGVTVPLSVILVGVSVGLRLRRARGVERQQLKWFAYATGLMCVIGLINQVGFSAGLPGSGFKPFQLLTFVVWLAIPFAVGVAILRHRLLDIDLVINRTLVYAALTAALAGLYFGSVVVLQGLAVALTGQQRSELVTVLSTLAIAALFNPLRGRIQGLIDQRFFRRKYDADKALARFGRAVRDQASGDLEQINADLMQVVDETLEPASISLWVWPGSGKDGYGRPASTIR